MEEGTLSVAISDRMELTRKKLDSYRVEEEGRLDLFSERYYLIH